MTKRGTVHHAEDPYAERDFGQRGRVGQSKSYNSGDNIRGSRQARTQGPEAGAKGVTRSDGPTAAGSGTSRDLKGPPKAPR